VQVTPEEASAKYVMAATFAKSDKLLADKNYEITFPS
jgi:hypothetical protein